MELVLNLAWLLLAALGVVLWAGRYGRRGCLLQVIVALGGVTVLLFPVISASDDLHAAAFAIEDDGRAQLQNIPVRAHAISHSADPVAALDVFEAKTAAPPRSLPYELEAIHPAMPHDGFVQCAGSRAPPLSSPA